MDKYYLVFWFIFILDLLPFLVQAQQRPKILEHPADGVAAREEPLTLNCKASGRPPPDIAWYHNGTPLVPSERRVILPEGSLFFLRVMQNKREQDAGVYWCEAKSSAGLAVSRNATLQIAVLRDDFRSVPKDTLALVGGPVVLNCTPPRGIPEPSVLWYKDGKLLDLSGKRLSMVDSGSLMISEIQASDAGKYECSAQSMAGSKTARPAVLTVLAPPTVIKGPQDTEVIEGEGLDLPCELTGDPKPKISWYRENENLPESRSRILLDNTLRIEDVRPEDQGRYICKGHNEGGNVSVAVQLNVYAVPTFIESPSDADIKEGGTIKLPCRAQGRPLTRIIWDRVIINHLTTTATDNVETSKFHYEETEEEILAKAKIMSLRSKRETMEYVNNTFIPNYLLNNRRKSNNNNNLTEKIPDLYSDENSRYKIDQNENFLLSEFKQIMRNENQETVDLTFHNVDNLDGNGKKTNRRFKRNINEDEEEGVDDDEIIVSEPTPIVIFSTPTSISTSEQSSFEISIDGELILRDVTTKDQGWYACAALNEAGSIVKKVFIRVLSAGNPDNVAPPELPGSRFGSERNIIINSIAPISSTSLNVFWDIADSIPATQTMTLHYRPLGTTPFKTVTTVAETKELTVIDLKAHTEYEIFGSLYGLSGSVSNIRKGKTMDGAPSAPPTDVRVGVINNTAAYVRWSPPPIHLLNGLLTGYKIQIKSNLTNKLLGQMSLNATTQSVVINSLSPGGRYIARVAPLTSGGLGPYSQPAPLHMDPSFISRPPKSDPASNGWSSAWMSGIALGIFGICLLGGAIFAIFWARQNKRNMKASYPAPIITTSISDKQHTLWLHGNQIVKPTHSLALPTADYAEVAQIGLPVKINPILSPPEPYATVTLKRNGGQSDDSCVKCSATASPSSSEYNAPVREPINLCDMLPPPPDHPYGSYKPPNNMTIRTNPAAMSPQVLKRIPPTPPSRWGTLGTLPPPIPNFPQNWIQQRRLHSELENNPNNYSENDYESGSVLYEQCCRQDGGTSYFGNSGEPTEEYYRNVNMEFFDEHDYQPSTPPPPCPDSNNKMNPNLRLLVNKQENSTSSINRPTRGQCNTQNVQSSDSESDNRWAPRSTKRSRSRSKSNDRKYRNGGQIR